MTKAKILVTGASGKTGRALVARLLEVGWPVRAVVRARDSRSASLEREGAQIVVADSFDVEALVNAARGTQRAYFVPPFRPNALHAAAAFAVAAREAKLEVIVGMSQWLASPSHPSIMTRQHWLIDELFSSLAGIGYIKLNPGYFADNYLRFVDFAALLGILPNLTGDSRNAPPSNEDIARVAAALLMNPAAHVGKSYRPTGPKLVSSHDVASVFAHVLGRRVRAVPMPNWLLQKAARRQGVPAFDIANLMLYREDHQQGAFELAAPNSVVLDITGQPAEALEVTALRYTALPHAQRGFGNAVRAWVSFLTTPFYPGFDLAALDASIAIPRAASARFAMRDDAWRSNRSASPTEPRLDAFA